MKKRWQIGFYLLLYLLVLAFTLDFDLRWLFSIRDMVVFFIGTALLAIPFCESNGEEKWLGRFFSICGKRAIDAGMLQTFLLLFIRMSEEKAYMGLLADVALCFRPMLYAFCIKLILERNEEEVMREVASRNDSSALEKSYEKCVRGGLTKREAEIAVLVCRGCSNGEIAEELVISQATVKKHMSNIFEKTGIKKREELRDYISKEADRYDR